MTTLTTWPAHAKSKLSIALDAILLIADLQSGIADLPLTIPQVQLKKNVAAMLKLAAIFDIPLIVTVVPGADGKPSPLMPEVQAGMRGASVYVRTTPNSMNDAEIGPPSKDWVEDPASLRGCHRSRRTTPQSHRCGRGFRRPRDRRRLRRRQPAH